MLVLTRALVYSSLFVAFVLVLLPAQLLTRFGVPAPEGIHAFQVAGVILVALGAAIVAWCVLAFVVLGRGTPLPLDPPRALVIKGPYRFVRNPMYVGAFLGLLGAAAYYESTALLVYAAAFIGVMHAIVVLYEEPTLRRSFGADYVVYCNGTGRWLPRRGIA